jgi:Skp family chaperone for outer membrane proteins
VKRTFIVAVGLLALGVIICAGRLTAQSGGTAPAAATPTTRIALLNMTYVMKWYGKFTTYQNELKQLLQPAQDKDKGLRAQADQLMKEVAKPGTTQADQEKMQKDLKEIKRAIEDNDLAARALLTKRSDEQMKVLYLDVVEAASRYARAHNFELVLHYNDAITREDFLGPANIGRKLQNGALMPLYAVQGLDISKEVVENLNYAMGQNTNGTAPGAAPAAPPAGTANPGSH